ncbi:ubiquitin-conjugating enzyme [Paracoccidioides lutzii Pb01]|uniref:Ubiquitin-conjugating enzyme n=1 Tax=Paracoccidioides lutzii (strain ATCC MYA-826 / Pb01) TaxID=502779 RepID=C1GY41_PARBA|nr:ubiquitin-conjugating enzyme [Paracoccidioides lutzii Pb01]EEH41432.2 ubiquitin-conjugating enzyme [Paracoccidioides lutzii Pb01]
MRRLASDHASLHMDGLPPNYLFPPSNSFSSFPDDLTQLAILLTGPQGTPYSQGLWQLHLRMPEDYPKSPPKAAFKTRIWHPNVDESTGAVCVDTLKRDWEAKLTLRDILITISCLLIHPNPDSALNSAAGSLLQDDYESFARQAKLMTSIHAPIPKDMKDAVMEAKRRGDDSGTVIVEDEDLPVTVSSRKAVATTSSAVIMKKLAVHKKPQSQEIGKLDIRIKTTSQNVSPLPSSLSSFSMRSSSRDQPVNDDGSDDEDTDSSSKENDPSLSHPPASVTPPSPRKSVLGKRPLSVLSSPSEPELVLVNYVANDDDDAADNDCMTSSQRNIAANASALERRQIQHPQEPQQQQQQRKSPKLSELGRGVNTSGRVRDGGNSNDFHSSLDARRGSRQNSIFGAPAAAAPASTISNEKRSDGGKENEGSSSILPPSITTTTDSATATAVIADPPVPDKSQHLPIQRQTLPPSSSIPSLTSIESSNLSNTSPQNKIRSPAPNMSMSTGGAYGNNNNTATRRVSSSTAKAKPRIGLRRLLRACRVSLKDAIDSLAGIDSHFSKYDTIVYAQKALVPELLEMLVREDVAVDPTGPAGF